MVVNFSNKTLSLDSLAVRIWRTEFVKGVFVKEIYSFDNFKKNFWTWVFFNSNFAGFFGNAAY